MLERTIEVKGAIDKSQFRSAARAVSIRLRGKRLMALGGAGAVVSLLGMAIAGNPETSAGAFLLRIVIPAFWVTLVLVILNILWLHPLRTVMAFKGIPLPMEMTWRFREEGVDVVSPKAESKLDWGHWVKGMETGEFFVLFQTAHVYNIIPKAAIPREEDLAAIRDLLQRKFAGKA